MLHSNELLLALDNVLTLVKDAETGQRGYVITGRPEYLTPYRTAVGTISAQLDALARLAREDPVQQRCWPTCGDGRRQARRARRDDRLRDRKGFDLTRE